MRQAWEEFLIINLRIKTFADDLCGVRDEQRLKRGIGRVSQSCGTGTTSCNPRQSVGKGRGDSEIHVHGTSRVIVWQRESTQKRRSHQPRSQGTRSTPEGIEIFLIQLRLKTPMDRDVAEHCGEMGKEVMGCRRGCGGGQKEGSRRLPRRQNQTR